MIGSIFLEWLLNTVHMLAGALPCGWLSLVSIVANHGGPCICDSDDIQTLCLVVYAWECMHYKMAPAGSPQPKHHLGGRRETLNLQGEEPTAWQQIHDMRHTLEVLWSLSSQQQLPIMSVLARVESPDFIHVKTKPEAETTGLLTGLMHRRSPATIGKRTILFELPRFQMTFELHAGQATAPRARSIRAITWQAAAVEMQAPLLWPGKAHFR